MGSSRAFQLPCVLKQILLSVCLLAVGLPAWGQTPAVTLVPTVDLIGGNGADNPTGSGEIGDNGPARLATIPQPIDAVADRAGNIYVAGFDNRIRRIDRNGTITTFAGTGTPGFAGDGGPATAAELYSPSSLCFDSNGNLYVADTGNDRIRKIDITGTITSVPAGTLHFPEFMTFDNAGNLYISDTFNYRIQKVTPSGAISTIAGTGVDGSSGDNGPATSAELHLPTGLAVDGSGDVLIADSENGVVRKITATDGIIRQYAGTFGSTGISRGDGGPALSATLFQPSKLILDSLGNLLIADGTMIRKVTALTSIIDSVPGIVPGIPGGPGPAPKAMFNGAFGIGLGPGGNISVAEFNTNLIKRIDFTPLPFPATQVRSASPPPVEYVYIQFNQDVTLNGVTVPVSQGNFQEFNITALSGCTVGGSVTAGTVCGINVTFTPGYPGYRAVPLVVNTSAGKFGFGLTGIGIAPLANFFPGLITTIAGLGPDHGGYNGDNQPAINAELSNVGGGAFDSSGNFYIPDNGNYRIRKIDTNGIITTFAGDGTSGHSGDNGPATAAQFQLSDYVTTDAAGSVYFTEYDADPPYTGYVRKVDPNGIITTVAGGGTSTADYVSATTAMLSSPEGVAVDDAGNLYFNDYQTGRIRKIDSNGIITTIVGTGTPGYSGDGGPATQAQIQAQGFSFAPDGTFYIGDFGNNRVRKVVAATGIITTIAGTGTNGYTGDGGPATSAEISFPTYAAVDPAGNLYITQLNGDNFSAVIRRVGLDGNINTIVGNGTPDYVGDGGPATQAGIYAAFGFAFDSLGNLYVSDDFNFAVREISVNSPPLAFSPTDIGQTSSTSQSSALWNIGNADLTITNQSLTPNFGRDSTGSCYGISTLSIGNNCTLALTFQPQQTGALSGSVTITDDSLNLPGSTQQISLTGTGLPAPTTTDLVISTDDTITFGTPVKLTATVSYGSSITTLPTGRITFFDNGAPLGTVAVPGATPGQASLNVPAFAIGTHSLTASYLGDTNFNASAMSAATPLTVTVASVDLLLTSNDNPSIYGQIVTLTASEAAATATGTVQFFEGATLLGAGTLSSGTAHLSISTLAAGTHRIVARYGGDASHSAASSDVLDQQVDPAPLLVTATSAARVYGTPNPAFTSTITGFVGSDTQASSVTGTPTIISSATAFSNVGSYTIQPTAGSLAAANYMFGFANGSLTVTQATPGVSGTAPATVSSSQNPSSWGQPVQLSAQLPPNATGTVSFYNGATLIGMAPVVAETAVITTSALTITSHPITAVYSGDGNYIGATSAALNQVVSKAVLTVTANNQQRVYGAPNPPLTSTFTGFVNGDTSATITGTPNLSTTATISSARGSYPITVALGTLASTNYSFSFVNGTMLVRQATPIVTLTTSASPVSTGLPIIFTATITASATGTVAFHDGATVLGTVPITSGIATLTISTLAIGTHTITASYSGDVNFTAATSTAITQVVTLAPDFAIASTTGPQLVPPGATASYAIVLSSVNASFTSPVTMAATNLPPGATFSFTPPAVMPATISPGVAPPGASTTLAISVPPQRATLHRSNLDPPLLALLLLPFTFFKRYGTQRLVMWVLIASTAFTVLTGCGAGGYFSQTQRTYTITVTGASGNLSHSTTVILSVE
jgi:trimeric autotransporter adhesin